MKPIALLTLLAATLLLGCSREPSDGVLAGGKISSSTGGIVQVKDEMKVVVPSDSLSGTGEVEVRRASVEVGSSEGPFLGLGKSYDIRLQGASVTGPLRLEFPVASLDLPQGATPEDVVGLYFDEPTRSWAALETLVDSTQNNM